MLVGHAEWGLGRAAGMAARVTPDGWFDEANISVAVTPNGQYVVSAAGDIDGTVRLWDLKTKQNVAVFSGEGRPNVIALAPDGLTVVVGEYLGRVYSLRIEGSKPQDREG